MGQRIKKGLLWFLTSGIWAPFLIIALDQWSKYAVVGWFAKNGWEVGHMEPMIPNFWYIKLQYNPGMAFSWLENYQPLLAAISMIAAVGFIAYLVWKWKKLKPIYRYILLMVIGGDIGNGIDRMISSKGVIDFMFFPFFPYCFNVADAFLTVSILLLAVLLIIDEVKEAQKKKQIINEEIAKQNEDENHGNEEHSDQ